MRLRSYGALIVSAISLAAMGALTAAEKAETKESGTSSKFAKAVKGDLIDASGKKHTLKSKTDIFITYHSASW